jgi:FkbM family methyltransferase
MEILGRILRVIKNRINNKIKNYKLKIKSKNQGYKLYFSKKLGLKLLLNLDSYIDYTIFSLGHYDLSTLKKMNQIINNFKEKEPEKKIIFFDIGSNIGLMSLYLKKKHPDIIIYAFEPVSANYYQNKINSIINDLDYSLFKVILGNRNINSKIIYLPDKKIHTDYNRINMGIPSIFMNKYRTGKSSEKCKMKTFDKFVEENLNSKLLAEFNILFKIDVEGSELNILEGMKNTFNSLGKSVFLIECLFKEKFLLYKEVVEFLRNYKYDIYDYKNNNFSLENLKMLSSGNYIFKKNL